MADVKDQRDSQNATGSTVLVVDDEAFNRRAMVRGLSREGITVLAARDGLEALKLIDRNPVDVVVLDIIMPGLDGLQTLAIIRRNRSLAELPVVMATGLDSREHIVHALRLGANDYITKPIDFELALARLNTQLELKRARDQVQELNVQLADAQRGVSRVLRSSSSALTDVAAWASTVARDAAEAVGVPEIGVWALEDEKVSALADSNLQAPRIVELALLMSRKQLERELDTVLPVKGLSAELHGALVVPGKEESWSPAARPLLQAFARQLGGVLELRQARDQLSGTPLPRAATPFPDTEQVQICRKCNHCFGRSAHWCPDCGPKAPLTSPWPLPYLVAVRYRLKELLAVGGMGMVFAAYDQRLDREVAIKVIKPEHSEDETNRTRFEREALAVASIKSPGVVAVHDYGELPGEFLYIVMERLYGRDLGALVRACGPGTPRQVAMFLREAATGLDAAHEADVIHRDIKPGNFVLCPSVEAGTFGVKILDFGIARRDAVDVTLTGTGSLVGTPMYMSPEQASGTDVGYRTDLYSLGAVTFWALVGRHMLDESNYLKILSRIVMADFSTLSDCLPNTPPEIDKALAWALAKNPDERPASAEVWVDSFVDVLEEMPTNAKGWLSEEGLLRSDTQRQASPTPPL